MRPSRLLSVTLLGVGAFGFAFLAIWLTPHWMPPGVELRPATPSEVLGPGELARVHEYVGKQRPIALSSYFLGLGVTLALGLTPPARRLAARLRGWWWARVLVMAAVVSAIPAVVTLPLSLWYRSHALAAGLTHQGLAGWFRDWATSIAVGWVGTSIGLLVLIGLARVLPRVWPAAVAGVGAVLVFAGSMLYPVLVEPLFNNFHRLPDGPTRTMVLALAKQEHVSISDVLVADASRRTTTINAYVTGIGSTRRVVLYDTAIAQLKPAELRSVVAHELAHAKYHDVAVGTLEGMAGVIATAGLLALIWPRISRGSRPDAGVVPILVALAAAAGFVAAPVQNTLSRAVEARADRTALEVTQEPDAFIEMQRRLAGAALQDPNPPAVLQWWFGSHPTPVQRIGMAQSLFDRDAQ